MRLSFVAFVLALLSACGSHDTFSETHGDDPQLKRLLWQGDTTQRNCFGYDPVNSHAVIRACATQGHSDALAIKDLSTQRPWSPPSISRLQIMRNTRPAGYLQYTPGAKPSDFYWTKDLSETYVMEKNEGNYRIRPWRLSKPGNPVPDLCITVDRARRLVATPCDDKSHIWKVEDFFN